MTNFSIGVPPDNEYPYYLLYEDNYMVLITGRKAVSTVFTDLSKQGQFEPSDSFWAGVREIASITYHYEEVYRYAEKKNIHKFIELSRNIEFDAPEAEDKILRAICGMLHDLWITEGFGWWEGTDQPFAELIREAYRQGDDPVPDYIKEDSMNTYQVKVFDPDNVKVNNEGIVMSDDWITVEAHDEYEAVMEANNQTQTYLAISDEDSPRDA